MKKEIYRYSAFLDSFCSSKNTHDDEDIDDDDDDVVDDDVDDEDDDDEYDNNVGDGRCHLNT
jgi:hypothetical protein